MSAPAVTPAPAPTPAAPETPATPTPSGELSEKNWDSNKWPEEPDEVDEESEVDDWLAEKDDDDADDEGEKESKPRRRARREEPDDDDDQDDDEDDEEEEEERPRKPKPGKPERAAGEGVQPDAAAGGAAVVPAYTVKLGTEARELDAAKMARALGTTDAELKALGKAGAEKLYQKLWHAEQQQAGGANAQNVVKTIVGNAKSKTREVLEALGVDVVEFANKVMVDEYEERTLPPDQKAIRQRERELTQREQAAQRETAQREQTAQHEAQQQATRALHTEVENALQDAGIAVIPRNKERIFLLMQRELGERHQSGSTEPPTPAKDLIATYDRELQDDFRARVKTMDGAQIAEYLGDEAVKKMREARVQKITAQHTAQVPQREADDEPRTRRRARPRKPEKRLFADVLREMKQKGKWR